MMVNFRHSLVIVGGGPAAAVEAVAAVSSGIKPLIISSQWGGIIDCMGPHLLQSFHSELYIPGVGLELSAFASSHPRSPTGAEYTRYIREVIRSLKIQQMDGTVFDVVRVGDHLEVVLKDGTAVPTDQVVLATGTRFRPPPISAPGAHWVSTDCAYRELTCSDPNPYWRKRVVILGGGNSAMQIAALAEPIAADVTVLASRYLGMYPQETDDRFAWRSLSQVTCELVAKSSLSGFTKDRSRASVRFLIYDSLKMHDNNLIFNYREAVNQAPICACSLPNNRPTWPQGCLKTQTGWAEQMSLQDCVLVSAIGVTSVYPSGPSLAEIPRSDGIMEHDARYETALDGVFIAGSCSGRRSITCMSPTGLFT